MLADGHARTLTSKRSYDDAACLLLVGSTTGGERVRLVAVGQGRGTVRVRRAVVADVSAPSLYERLLPHEALPARLLQDLQHFTWDTPVVKVNYALDAPIPWRSKSLKDAGTVHLGADSHGLIR